MSSLLLDHLSSPVHLWILKAEKVLSRLEEKITIYWSIRLAEFNH